ncbi:MULTISPECIES: cell division protein FtsX [Leeuwenhoekiella]|jgi:cell division transport system permease protein|uniref:Cell division protein FtsX n=1 Tax=Leeuwenhoekiella blandensis (strain CECT 7118 / CCUG 51940 / KCTC 22103 / MED217) TaxID=398720 RepID=A3XQ34_LEEBM|nr:MULTISPECIES: permease-like cell division protein FtsX [Leeuwenhoekiella]EAQ48335.1 putative cell division protein [Leeuwenhoekiella blandensis MED217]MAO43889.1 ABC transporter permease [Leeuwenhoekiella sp.]HBT10746.1 ABC transporter permease [Leeuwenhoekiella sp.]HCW63582.1 ABC transporter permease [Leeuwenhoekiella sp.]|tara:strand:- start:260554 stop:261432 length:879 start_codon:yes stop_codon:yes gene_type:complete
MASSFEKFQRRRLISSYFSVILSIALVLFLLGLLGLLVLNSKKVADHFKEQIALTIYLKDDAKDVEIKQLEKTLALADYTKSTQFVSKEEAAEEHSKEIGENFMDFLGYNPLQNSIDVYLKADFVDAAQVKEIADNLLAKDFVEEVNYDQPLISLLNDNIKKISLWVMIISGVFTLIAVLLINSAIRLSVYSKRFTIKTMQMVGATKGFIRRPFIWLSMKLGMVGAVIALAGMAAVLYYLNQTFPELELLADPMILAILFVGVFVASMIITWFSTFLATQRFLNLRTDELYY